METSPRSHAWWLNVARLTELLLTVGNAQHLLGDSRNLVCVQQHVGLPTVFDVNLQLGESDFMTDMHQSRWICRFAWSKELQVHDKDTADQLSRLDNQYTFSCCVFRPGSGSRRR